MKTDLFTVNVSELFPFLESILIDLGKSSPDSDVKTFKNEGGYSGYSLKNGSIAIGMILGGTGFVLKRASQNGEWEEIRYDYFNTKGEFTFSAQNEALTAAIVDGYEMDLSSPILNHVYNFLALEYRKAQEGSSSTEMVYACERFLRLLYKNKAIKLPVEMKANDPAITRIYHQILKAEMDPVLTWEERQLVFGKYRETLHKIIKTKIRAHGLNKGLFRAALMRKGVGNFLARFISRPGSNSLGILHRYTIGKVIWFFQTVRDNLGYSIALAVYGPFTYYFITMPMNPHAMQAVGKVRSTYLEAKTEISRIIDTRGASIISQLDISGEEANADDDSQPLKKEEVKIQAQESDSVTTKAAAPEKSAVSSNILYPSESTAEAESLVLSLGNGKTAKVKPSLMNMLVSSDVPLVNQQSWFERMSNFKQMQIAYEENIEYASRMGRLEQLETQYNFPMQVESTWEELERYNSLIFKIRTETPNLSAKMKQFLFNEVSRTQQLQVYLWDRLSRFILDQPYVMLDQDKEQKRNDYYVGRSFVFLQEMTNVLSWRYKNLKKPEGFEKIAKLADFYEKSRKNNGTVLKNLQANSDLFKQKDVYDTKEFRSYMKRQWEILYLQNAKAEEASNNGLNMYIWSVRNTVWVLQSIYSAKREELALLLKRDTSGQLFSPSELSERNRISMLYETLFHNLTLEYVGIREEIMNRLGKDIESAQRMTVINNLKEFLTDRDKLDGVHTAEGPKTAGSKL